jgi:murein DD-endopeptidase MepM/ murein hydrolase activator NlpD
LSAFAIIGVFITSITLATNRPINSNSNTESQVINLPNLPAELQNISNISSPASSMADEAVTPLATIQATEEPSIEPLPIETNDADPISTTEAPIIEDTQVTEQLAQPTINWQEVTVKSGDNLSLIFPRVGLSARDVYNVAQLGKDIKPLLNLKPGQTLRFDISESEGSKHLNALQLQLSKIKTLSIASTVDGYESKLDVREVEKRQSYASATINSSLFEAGVEAGLSDKLVMELAHIFGWDIDFALDLRQGDQFSVIYTEEYLDGDKIADGNILAAEFTNQGNTFRAVHYVDDSGHSEYFSPSGDSMRKAFSRTPVHFSRISSKFNPNRKHPKLAGVTRPHRGVDYAAATGTPILATGDGKVDFAGTKGGYGRTIVLSHGGKYTTLYAHMSRYRKGIKRGKRVKQGDVIGYVGMTGTATGPHLHYEFRINGVHRNPLTVSLPKAQALNKKYRADFEQKSQPLLAQLDSLRSTAVALNQ